MDEGLERFGVEMTQWVFRVLRFGEGGWMNASKREKQHSKWMHAIGTTQYKLGYDGLPTVMRRPMQGCVDAFQ